MDTKHRILVVDDDDLVLEAVARTLKIHGYEVVATLIPQEGVALAQRQNFDAVVSDVSMPTMNGFEMRDAICKAVPALVGKFVFVSGGADTPKLAEMLRQADYLQKPYRNDALIARIHKITG